MMMESVRISPHSTTTIMEQRKKIKVMLQKELQINHKIEWSLEKENSPLRIRPKETVKSRLQVIVKNWIKAISTTAKVKPIQTEKYVLINFMTNDRTTYASVYGSGTVMFQGKNSQQWLQENAGEIVNKITSDNKKGFKDLRKPSTEQTNCTICQKEYTDDMVECQGCKVWIHYDCDIDGIIDNESEHRNTRIYMCPPCRASPHKDPVHSRKKTNMDSTIKTRTSRRTATVSQANSENKRVSEANLNDRTVRTRATTRKEAESKTNPQDDNDLNETYIVNTKDTTIIDSQSHNTLVNPSQSSGVTADNIHDTSPFPGETVDIIHLTRLSPGGKVNSINHTSSSPAENAGDIHPTSLSPGENEYFIHPTSKSTGENVNGIHPTSKFPGENVDSIHPTIADECSPTKSININNITFTNDDSINLSNRSEAATDNISSRMYLKIPLGLDEDSLP